MPDVVLSDHFEQGAKVGAYERTGDFFPGVEALGSPVKTATVKNGIEFKGLDEGRYWVAPTDGSASGVAFVSKEQPAAKVRTEAPQRANPQLHPRVNLGSEIVTGAKGTKVSGRLVETPLPKGQEAHPSLNQASVGEKTPQRSSTPIGQATPTDPDEVQPHPRQEDVKERQAQRSDTETGEAEPVSKDAGPVRQEDFKGPQRSDTETGEATPIGSAEPRGTDVNPDSQERAEGVRSTDGDKPQKSGRSDESGPNPEIAAEGRKTPRRR